MLSAIDGCDQLGLPQPAAPTMRRASEVSQQSEFRRCELAASRAAAMRRMYAPRRPRVAFHCCQLRRPWQGSSADCLQSQPGCRLYGSPSRRIALLGSTGSIGHSTLEVVRALAGRVAGRRSVGPSATGRAVRAGPAAGSRDLSSRPTQRPRASFDWSGLPRADGAARRPGGRRADRAAARGGHCRCPLSSEVPA